MFPQQGRASLDFHQHGNQWVNQEMTLLLIIGFWRFGFLLISICSIHRRGSFILTIIICSINRKGHLIRFITFTATFAVPAGGGPLSSSPPSPTVADVENFVSTGGGPLSSSSPSPSIVPVVFVALAGECPCPSSSATTPPSLSFPAFLSSLLCSSTFDVKKTSL